MSKFTDGMYAALKISNARNIAAKYGCTVISFHRYDDACPVVTAIAEGYGWTESEC
ncbi:hypothetical protein [Streptomyces sp. NPDC059788]|uniref:hypothetical protein n=1 Tax=Streptomyces sp. NPDC059788 TaxID=3346948 RepID=UPI00364A5E5D